MKKFKDANSREWIVNIDVETIERVRDLCGVNLAQLFGEADLSALALLYDDPCHLAKVLDVVLTPNQPAEEKAALMAGLTGDALEAAANALVEATIDFFPNPRRRDLARQTVRKLWGVVEAQQDRAIQKLSELDPTSLVSAMTSAPSSELTPAK